MSFNSILYLLIGCISFHYFIRNICNYINNDILKQWQEDEGYTISKKTLRFVFRGPFFLYSRYRSVYRMTLVDRDGIVLRGWACCGSDWTGMILCNVEAEIIVEFPEGDRNFKVILNNRN